MKKIIEKLRYQFDQFLAKGTGALVVSLFLIMFLITLIIGTILYLIDPQLQLPSLIWTILMQTLDAGNLSDVSGSPIYMAMMTLATLVGIFITSLFISIILNGFQERLEVLSRGRSKVIEKKHTLILGWNDNIFVIIKELIEANRSVRRPAIVILSDHDSVTMNQQIRDNIPKSYNTRIICRTGSIYKKTDLQMCNIADAKSIIILENDLNIIKALLVISDTDFYLNSNGHITVLMSDKSNIAVAKTIAKDRLAVIYLNTAITRIITQTCLQSGLSQVYNELFDFEGDEIYFYQDKRLTGLRFDEAILSFDKSAVFGVFRDGQTYIRPAFDWVLSDQDQLILIASDDNQIEFTASKPLIDQSIINLSPHQSSIHHEIISMIGFNFKTIDVIEEFANYLKPGSMINILVSDQQYANQLPKRISVDIDINVTIGETFARETLEQFLVPQSKRVIIFANNDLPNADKDAQTLLTLLHLRALEEERHMNLNVISEIADVNDSDIIDLAKSDDFIISELTASKVMAQVSENAHLLPIFDDLLSTEGSEIYLKPAQDYVKIGVEVDFYTIAKAAMVKDEIAIAYQLNHQQHHANLVINPDKRQKLIFKEGDKIVVIAQD